MAFAIIRPQTKSAVVTLAAAAWTDVFQNVRSRATLPQIDATTYAQEANGQFIAGVERMTFDLTGLLTKGRANSGPIMPLSNFQSVVFTMQYDTGCSVSATINASDSEINQPAGSLGIVTATLVTTGTITVTWVLA